MKYTRHLVKHSLIYGSGESLIRLASFLLIPVYTRYLIPNEYGTLQLLIITSNLVATVLELGMGSAIFKAVLYGADADERTTYSTAFYFTLLASFTGIFPLLFFREELLGMIVGSRDCELAFAVLILSVFFRSFSIIPFARLRIEDRSGTYVAIALVKFILQIALNIYFVVVLRQGILGISLAQLISSLVLMVVFIRIMSGSLRISFSTVVLKDMLEYGLPLVPGAVALFVMNMSNRYFLKHYSSVEDVALYSLGYYVALIVHIIVYAFQRVWASAMFKIAKEKEPRRIFAQNFTYLILVLSSVTLLLSIFSREIVLLMSTREYLDSYRVVPFLSLSFLFYGVYFYLSYGMNIKKMTRYQPMIIGVSAGLNLLLNIVLIPRYGMLGAAVANTSAFVLMGVLAGMVSNRFYPVSVEVGRLTHIGIVFALVLPAGLYISFDSVLLAVISKSILLVLAGVILFVTGFFTPGERARFRRALNSVGW
jgi:O-antigen/teichoic acid export membrane protein